MYDNFCFMLRQLTGSLTPEDKEELRKEKAFKEDERRKEEAHSIFMKEHQKELQHKNITIVILIITNVITLLPNILKLF